jgi:putative FmdB family regulatory protein
MPVYELICCSCQYRYSKLVGVVAGDGNTDCPRCGGSNIRRVVSRFARLRDEDERLEALEDSVRSHGGEERGAMMSLMKELGPEIRDEFGEDADELIEEMEKESALGGEDESAQP